MVPRLYLPQPLRSGERIAPDREALRYLTRTLRLRPGGELTLFNGVDDGEWSARLVEEGGETWLEVLGFRAVAAESPLAVTLVLGVTKGDALEWVVQKGTELGVAAVIPLISRRSVRRPEAASAANRQRRWRRIAEEAAEQCGRVRVPEIHPPSTWEALPGLLPPGPRLLFWEEARDGRTLGDLDPPGAALSLLVGPEGGFDREEVAWARTALHCAVLGLGPRILRAETAAIGVTTACQLLWGDWR